MKRYRLGYDYLFLANKSFNYKGETIGAMAIYVLFKVFDKEGNEVLFESDELTDQRLYFKNEDSSYLYNFYKCFIEKNNIFELVPNMDLLKRTEYSIEFEINSYDKLIDIGNSKYLHLEPIIIKKDEFMDIMRNNIDLFDISDNKPVQTTSYFTQELKENELPKILGKKHPKIEPKERYTLELVTNVEPIFKYESCKPILINSNISTAQEARKLATSLKHLLKGKQFFLLTKYENERIAFSGKLYNV